MAKLPFVIRQSLLEQSRCLYRLNQMQGLNVEEPESEFAKRGTDFHALAKLYVDHLAGTSQSTDWTYARDLTTTKDWNEEAVRIFVPWAEHSIFDPGKIFASEYKVRLNEKFEACDEHDAVYSGDMDRVDIGDNNSATIVDYKTFWQIKEPDTIQAIFYPWLLFKVAPYLDSITFVLDFVRYPGATRRREFTRNQLQRMDAYVENQVQRLAEAYADKEWPAAVNAGCAYCRLECPLVAAGLSIESVGQVQSPAHASSMAQQMFALKRAYSQLQTALKAYSNEFGPIDAGNDIRLGYSKQDQFEYDVKAIQALNEEHGFVRDRGLKVASGEVKKIGKSYPEYVMRAKIGSKDRSKTVFKFSSEHGDPLEYAEDDDFD